MYIFNFNILVIRRAEVEMVVHPAQNPKDLWDQFLAHLSMRRNVEMSCEFNLQRCLCMKHALLVIACTNFYLFFYLKVCFDAGVFTANAENMFSFL